MMRLLLYQLTRHFGRESNGDWTEFPFFSRFKRECLCFYQVLEIVESDKFQDNFTMALCSFGGVNDQCSATSWAVHETGMIPLLSCDNDMTAWLKDKYKESGASGARGRCGVRQMQTADFT